MKHFKRFACAAMAASVLTFGFGALAAPAGAQTTAPSPPGPFQQEVSALIQHEITALTTLERSVTDPALEAAIVHAIADLQSSHFSLEALQESLLFANVVVYEHLINSPLGT